MIPHGAFDYLTALPDELPLPPELQGAEGPVILFFGLAPPVQGDRRPAATPSRAEGAELWVVGNPRMDVAPAPRASPREAPGTVRFVARFVADAEIPAFIAPRRPRRPSLPRHRAVRRALHRARLRAAAGAQRRRRLPRGAERRAPLASSRPEDPEALGRRSRSCSGTRPPARELAAAARAAAERPVLLGPRRGPDRSTSTAAAGVALDDRRRGRLLARRRPDRLHAPRLPAAAVALARAGSPARGTERRGRRATPRVA